MSPLKPGTHVVDSYIVMSALHCDGLGDSVADNCLQGVIPVQLDRVHGHASQRLTPHR